MANTYLTRTTGTPTDHKKYTFSIWIKRCDIGAANSKIFSRTWGSGGEEKLEFNADDLIWRNTSGGGGSTNWERVTNRKFRDSSGYYHIVITFDSTQSTAGDRLKMWINGVQETSFSSSSDPSLNAQSAFMDSGIVQNYGRYGGGSQYTSSIWSHVHLTDGYAYAASDFGETDATTGEWKIKTDPSVTYGTNGFWWFKDNANTTDNSPNSNTFTVAGGTLTKTEDNPSNIFASWNSQHNYFEGATYSCGNNKVVTGGNNIYTYNNSTLGMTTGKYYCEIKNVTAASSDNLIGITDRFTTSATHELGNFNTQWAYRMGGGLYTNNTHTASWGASWAVGDYIGIGLDLDNNKLYFSKNGTWQNPSAGISITDPASVTDGCYYFSFCGFSDQNEGCEANFGNGSFGTTQLTGTTYAGADGNGIFKYDPNNITLDGASKSFKSLSTKGLNA